MKLTEKMSYLKGYIDALDLGKNTKEWQVISKMSEVMDDMVEYIEDLQNQVDEVTELCEVIDEDLGEVEQEIYGVANLDGGYIKDEDDYEERLDEEFDEDDQLYEATCPTCGRTIILDEAMLEDGGVECACGESLEFDFEGLEDEDEYLSDDELQTALDVEFVEDLEELNSLDADASEGKE
jgi:DNA repair exonuclease SbcCD ATPase subunit